MKFYLRLLLFVFLMLFTQTESLFAFSVDSIRFGNHPEKTRIVIELSDTVDFRSFILQDPNRVVVDLPEFSWKSTVPSPNEKAGVKEIRYGELKTGLSRLVLDMNKKVSILNAFLLPKASGRPDRLVIDIVDQASGSFKPAQKKIFGNLDISKNYGVSLVKTQKPRSKTAPAWRDNGSKKPLIIIDPGHGGVDPGAIGANGVHEKVVALALAKELKKQLEKGGKYNVKLTRNSDVFIKLSDRVKFAREKGGDLFISIHADSVNRPNVRGASIYTLSEKASDAQTAKLAERENKADLIAGIDLSTEDKEVANILMDLAKRDTMNQSKYFANTLVSSLQSKGVKLLQRPHRYAGFAVLKAPDIPSVLVESGFMSNRKEAGMLSKPKHRKKIAQALKAGVDQYFETVAINNRS